VAISNDDQNGGSARGDCAECGSPFSGNQRYCLECGARRGDLPAAIAARIAPPPLPDRSRGPAGAEQRTAREEPRAAVDSGAEQPLASRFPSPRAAAAAVMGMLALGVLLGSATSQIAQSAGVSSLVVQLPAEAPAPEPEEVVEAEPEAVGSEAPAPLVEAPLPLAPEALPEEFAPEPEAPIVLPPEIPEEEGLPEVKHLFLIVLGDNGYEETFGAASTAPYLSIQLPAKGELLSNYYAVTQGSLANQIALISGQGPTPETAANCPNYTDVVPGTASAEGQIEGNGCVYPAEAEALPGQLAAAGLKWRGYVEDIDHGIAAGQPPSCRHPALGGPDTSAAPVPGDGYMTWRNPFVYFHSILDSPECAENDVGFERLATDLASAKKTPTLSYIVPNACHSGGEVPCEPTQAAGAVAVEPFLKRVVPAIMASAAYKEGGLIAITSAQAPQTGEHADQSSCCVSPAYPNLPPPAEAEEPVTGPVKPTGGGRVGLLLISPFVQPGSLNETSYSNHYTLLLTIEELFGLEKLGYANEIALTAFDNSVFNAGAEEESTVEP
jgi:hypothetical protein